VKDKDTGGSVTEARLSRNTGMRNLLLCVLVAAMGGALLGQEFEAVSVRPNNSGRFDSHSHSDQGLLTATNLTLRSLISTAFGIADYQLEGPDWLATERFDISAKFPEALPKDRDKYNAAMSTMMRKMLEDRFKLAAHREKKTLSVYGLTVAKTGVKFKEAPQGHSRSNSHDNYYEGSGIGMDQFAEYLSRHMDMPVLDMTGLKGAYEMTLQWFPDPKTGETPQGPALREALQEQLGLKLENRKAPIEIVVVDHADKTPSEN
jgi:uncharacterized protein (TIGR03435 family)